VIFWDPEDAFDVFRVSHTDLDMCFAAEARCGVEGFAFGEDGSDGVNRVLARFFARFVQKIKDHAIKFAVEEVVSTQILRDLRA